MKRIIYTLTAIFSAVAASVFIIEYIAAIERPGEFFFAGYPCPQIAMLLAFGILSVIQLKKHTPKIMLLLCGYIFYEAALTLNYQYLFGLLLMAAALTPAIYELSRYGMAVRHEPKRNEKIRWPLIAAIPLALGLTAYRVMLSTMQAVRIVYGGSIDFALGPMFISYPSGIIGIAALLCAAAFCVLVNRRTGVLYRMFLTGCIIFDSLYTALINYNYIFPGNYFPVNYLSGTAVKMFILFEVIYALFILLIFLHALLTKRGSPMPHEAPGMAEQAFNNAIKEG